MTGFRSYVSDLAVSGSTVYAGGDFSSVGGQPRNNIAAIDSATGAVTAWDPNAGPNDDPHARGVVTALAVSAGMVYVAGGFHTIGGQPRNYIAALEAATGAATAWDPNPNGSVQVLLVSGNTIRVGGYFSIISGSPRNSLAALDVATGAATTWAPSASYYVMTLALSGSRVYVGGHFTSIDGKPQSYFAAVPETYPLSVRDDPVIMENSLTVAPNPTRTGMQVRYSVVRSGRVRLELLDVSGRVVATLADRVQESGRHVATWDGVGRSGRLSPGLHFIRLVTVDRVMVKKVAIIR